MKIRISAAISMYVDSDDFSFEEVRKTVKDNCIKVFGVMEEAYSDFTPIDFEDDEISVRKLTKKEREEGVEIEG